MRLYVYYRESIETAIGEVKGVLKRYPRLRSLRVGISTGSWEIAESLESRLEQVLEKAMERDLFERRVESFVETELLGHVVEGK